VFDGVHFDPGANGCVDGSLKVAIRAEHLAPGGFDLTHRLYRGGVLAPPHGVYRAADNLAVPVASGRISRGRGRELGQEVALVKSVVADPTHGDPVA
jgi:hypothetical protein